mmetsp:Transcript_12500/g.34434  ORF Transcript_12500/g.34434 Transcript_12500/m.34434 type:complete len:137 (-) Transcript_12500:491-901(-)
MIATCPCMLEAELIGIPQRKADDIFGRCQMCRHLSRQVTPTLIPSVLYRPLPLTMPAKVSLGSSECRIQIGALIPTFLVDFLRSPFVSSSHSAADHVAAPQERSTMICSASANHSLLRLRRAKWATKTVSIQPAVA